MLDENDDQFYKALPFTLTQQQTKPNFVIFGTGLQECLIAAHYSKLHQKPGLIIDIQRTYGGSLKTVTIKQLVSLVNKKVIIRSYEFLNLPQFQQQNHKYYTDIIENKTYKGYNIDIEPNFFFGQSLTCELLKQATMDKYMDFRLVKSMLNYDGKELKNIPLSKGKIFQSKDLGLIQKKLLLKCFHTLIQIYNRYMHLDQDLNSTKEFDKEFAQVDQLLYLEFQKNLDVCFLPFLSNLTKNNNKIMNFIIYIIANYQYDYHNQLPQHVKNQYTLSSFIKRFGKFIKSCGIYGQGPYLYVDNGIGDVPQAFSRIASVYLSTYILHPKIQISKIQVQDKIKIYTNLYPGGYLETQEVFYGPTLTSLKLSDNTQYYQQFVFRTILLCSKLGSEQVCPGIAYLLDLQHCENPVYLFMFDSQSHTCPQKMILYQFETIIKAKTEQSYTKKIRTFIETLTTIRGIKFPQSILYTAAYIRTRKYEKQTNKDLQSNQKILKDSSGIDLDNYFIHFKQNVPEQLHYFKKQKIQHEEQQQQNYGDQTSMLLQKLEGLNINKEKDQKQPITIQQTAKQEKTKQEKTKQETAKQETAKQEMKNEQSKKQETIIQEIKNEQPKKQETVTQETTKQEIKNEQSKKQESVKQETTNEQAKKQGTAKQQIKNEQPKKSEKTNEQEKKQEASKQATVKQAKQEITNEQAKKQETTKQETTKQEIKYQKTSKQEINNQQIKHEPNEIAPNTLNQCQTLEAHSKVDENSGNSQYQQEHAKPEQQENQQVDQSQQ